MRGNGLRYALEQPYELMQGRNITQVMQQSLGEHSGYVLLSRVADSYQQITAFVIIAKGTYRRINLFIQRCVCSCLRLECCHFISDSQHATRSWRCCLRGNSRSSITGRRDLPRSLSRNFFDVAALELDDGGLLSTHVRWNRSHSNSRRRGLADR